MPSCGSKVNGTCSTGPGAGGVGGCWKGPRGMHWLGGGGGVDGQCLPQCSDRECTCRAARERRDGDGDRDRETETGAESREQRAESRKQKAEQSVFVMGGEVLLLVTRSMGTCTTPPWID